MLVLVLYSMARFRDLLMAGVFVAVGLGGQTDATKIQNSAIGDYHDNRVVTSKDVINKYDCTIAGAAEGSSRCRSFISSLPGFSSILLHCHAKPCSQAVLPILSAYAILQSRRMSHQ